MQKMHDRKNVGKLLLIPSMEPKPKPDVRNILSSDGAAPEILKKRVVAEVCDTIATYTIT